MSAPAASTDGKESETSFHGFLVRLCPVFLIKRTAVICKHFLKALILTLEEEEVLLVVTEETVFFVFACVVVVVIIVILEDGFGLFAIPKIASFCGDAFQECHKLVFGKRSEIIWDLSE
jgi:hypothetical protein